jgi:aspartate carbamoyltransferase catalytic subunit
VTGEAAADAGANRFAGCHVLSMAQYDRLDLDLLFAEADAAAAALAAGRRQERLLAGRLMVSAFFERSTRTRLAHEAAMLRLGGGVIGFAEASVTRSGGRTDESDDDIARMLSLYGDVVVVRHAATDWSKQVARASHGALFINAGDGVGEHPTQALVDLYSMWQRFGTLDGLRVLLVNDLRTRCVHSLLLGLGLFGAEVYAVRSDGGGVRDEPAPAGAPPVIFCDDVTEVLSKVDVIYSSPTVSASPDGGRAAADQLLEVKLDRKLLEAHANEHLTVLHPLPRKGELATDLDDSRFNGYWAQSANGVTVRMALLKLMFET